MKFILSIDQGTTGSRAVLYDHNGRIYKSAYQEFRQYFPKPGWVEHNPAEIWDSVIHSIQKVLQGIPVGSVAGIGITNQRETTVIWDKDTGRPVHNAIVWQCRRTAPRCVQLRKSRAFEVYVKKSTGLPLDAYFSATKIEWILKNVPGALARARQGNLLFGTTDTWLLWKLTGGAVHATDYTNASRTMVFNIAQLKWDKKLLRAFGIPEKVLPRVMPSSGVFGRTVCIGKLPAGIPISGIAGDQQAALFGQACFEPATMKNTYGTGAFLLFNTGDKRIVSRNGLITTLGCGTGSKPVYVLEGAVFIAGAAIQWLRDGLKILPTAAVSQKMAESVQTNEGVYFVPALVGLGAPYWDANARGIITGLTRGTTANHLVRAALEAVSYQTKDVVEAMQKDSGLKLRHLKIDGGAAANDFLCQFQADQLRIDIIRPRVIETTSLGAAYLAGLTVGFWKNTSEIKEYWKIDKVFKPKMAATTADGFYTGWKKAVEQALNHA